MLSQSQELAIAQLFYQVYETQEKLEPLRQSLFKYLPYKNSFEKLFYSISPDGHLNCHTLIAFLKQHSILWEMREAKLFIFEFDNYPKDELLGVQEFQKIVKPHDKDNEMDFLESKRSGRSEQEINLKEALPILAKLIEQIYLKIVKTQDLKMQLISEIRPQDVIEALDNSRKGYVVEGDLEVLLEKYKLITRQTSNSFYILEMIIHGVDCDNDKRINAMDIKKLLQIQNEQPKQKSNDPRVDTSGYKQLRDKSINEKVGNPNYWNDTDEPQQQKQKHYSPLRRKKIPAAALPHQDQSSGMIQPNASKDHDSTFYPQLTNQSQMKGTNPDKSNTDSLYRSPGGGGLLETQKSPDFGFTPNKVIRSINQESPERIKADEDDRAMKETFSKSYHNKNHVREIMSEYLKKVIDIEQQVEIRREKMALEKHFNIYETFRYFDRQSRGYLYVHDFLVGIQELGLKDYTEDDVLLVFRRYDQDLDGTLRFSEFTHAFSPLQEQHEKLMMERKPKSLKKEFREYMFNYKFKLVLVDFLSCLINSEKEQFTQKKELLLKQDTDFIGIKNLFAEVDNTNDEFITKPMMHQYLESCGIILSEKELDLLFKVFDRDRDEIIDFYEFFRIIQN